MHGAATAGATALADWCAACTRNLANLGQKPFPDRGWSAAGRIAGDAGSMCGALSRTRSPFAADNAGRLPEAKPASRGVPPATAISAGMPGSRAAGEARFAGSALTAAGTHELSTADSTRSSRNRCVSGMPCGSTAATPRISGSRIPGVGTWAAWPASGRGTGRCGANCAAAAPDSGSAGRSPPARVKPGNARVAAAVRCAGTGGAAGVAGAGCPNAGHTGPPFTMRAVAPSGTPDASGAKSARHARSSFGPDTRAAGKRVQPPESRSFTPFPEDGTGICARHGRTASGSLAGSIRAAGSPSPSSIVPRKPSKGAALLVGGRVEAGRGAALSGGASLEFHSIRGSAMCRCCAVPGVIRTAPALVFSQVSGGAARGTIWPEVTKERPGSGASPTGSPAGRAARGSVCRKNWPELERTLTASTGARYRRGAAVRAGTGSGSLSRSRALRSLSW